MFPASTRILVVDDLKTIRVLLGENLRKLGYSQIDEAGDGNAALQMLTQAHQDGAPYGLIIADWNMPGMTGLELLEARNADPKLNSTPFLMVTIESEREYVLKAIAMGVNDFIVKPFSEKTLQGKMQSIFDRIKKRANF